MKTKSHLPWLPPLIVPVFLALILGLAGCDSDAEEACTTDGPDDAEYHLVACLNGEPWEAIEAVAYTDSTGAIAQLAFFGSIGYPPPPEGLCDPYPCRRLRMWINGRAAASPGDYFTVLSESDQLHAYFAMGYDDVDFAYWSAFDEEGRPVAQEPTWLRITEFDTLNHVMGGTFELTLPRQPGGLTSEEAGVPLPEVVRFREGRFRLPIWQPSGT